MARTVKTREDTATEPVEASGDAPTTTDTAALTPRPGSKLAKVVEQLEGEAGATIPEIMTATTWQQHTVRGALAGSITKKLGRSLTSEKIEGRGRVQAALLSTGWRVATVWECALRKLEEVSVATDRLSAWLPTETDTHELGERKVSPTTGEGKDVGSTRRLVQLGRIR